MPDTNHFLPKVSPKAVRNFVTSPFMFAAAVYLE